MKKIALVLIAIALISASAFAGDMAKQGQWGIQTAIGVATSPQSVASAGLKFMASENIAVRVELGFGSASPAGGGGSTSGYQIGAGFEYHMESKGGDVSPYVGLQVGYGGESLPTPPAPAPAPVNSSVFAVQGVLGGEYFFSSNFSWAGEVGLGFRSAGASGATSTTIATGSATMIATWYLF